MKNKGKGEDFIEWDVDSSNKKEKGEGEKNGDEKIEIEWWEVIIGKD